MSSSFLAPNFTERDALGNSYILPRLENNLNTDGGKLMQKFTEPVLGARDRLLLWNNDVDFGIPDAHDEASFGFTW